MSEIIENNNDEKLVSAYVHKVIESYVSEKGIHSFKIKTEAGSLKGDNYLGIIGKSCVTGKDKDGKEVVLNLIVKSAPKAENFRKVAPIRLAYHREIYMYATILPKFVEFQKEKHVKDPFNSIARCVASTLKDCDEAIIMEDMKVLGYYLENRLKPLSIAHVRLVVKELAKLHAISFALRDQEPKQMKIFDEQLKENFMDSMDFEAFEKQADVSYDKIESILQEPQHSRSLERFRHFRKDIIKDFRMLISGEEAGKAAIVRHGDCWTNNFLFIHEENDKTRTPIKICFLDWQLSHMGSPTLDLLYLIFACTDKTLRDAHYDELMRMYYDILKKQTADMGTNLEKYFTFSDLEAHLVKFGRYGLAMAIMIIPIISSESDEVPDFNEIFENGGDFVEALNFTSKNSEVIDNRIRDVMADMVERGYI